LPIRINNAIGVEKVSFELEYDPNLLSLSGASLSPNLPNDWILSTNLNQLGKAIFNLSGSQLTTEVRQDLVILEAFVPGDAIIGSSQILSLSNLNLNQGNIAVVADKALQQVAYLGDVSGNGLYSILDASLIIRVAKGLDTGFDFYRNTDPRILAGIKDKDILSEKDALAIVRQAVGILENDIPDLPKSSVIKVATTDTNAGETATDITADLGSFTLTRIGNTSTPLTVNYTLTGTATQETDYENLTGTVSFAVGSATALVNINPIDDPLAEGNETVILTLEAGTGYIVGKANKATVDVLDDELIGVTLLNKPEEGLFETARVVENGEVVVNLFENRNSLPIFSRYVNRLGELLKTINYQDNAQPNEEQVITLYSDGLRSERQYVNKSGFVYKVQNFESDNINTEIEFKPNGEKIVSSFNINPSTSENIYLTSQFLNQNGKISQLLEYKYFVLQSSPPVFIRSIRKQIDYNPATEKITSISINSFKDSLGNVIFQSRQDFDSQERLVKTTEFQFDGSVKSETTTQYLSDGLIITDSKEGGNFKAQQIFQTINGKKELVSSQEYIYNSSGTFEKTIEILYRLTGPGEENLKVINIYTPSQLVSRQIYEVTDSGTRLIGIREFASPDAENNQIEKSTFFSEDGEKSINFRKNGQLIKQYFIDASERLKQLITYERDLQGLSKKTVVTTFEYDGFFDIHFSTIKSQFDLKQRI
jgi:hypothetical protein